MPNYNGISEESFKDRLIHAWNAFRGRDRPSEASLGNSSFNKPDRNRSRMSTERTNVNAIYNRLAVDASSCVITHARLDQNGTYQSTIDSDLNRALTIEANTDQTGRALIQDAVMSMCDEGVVAIVPVDTKEDPFENDSFRIKTLRVGQITQWFPQFVRVKLYNETTGQKDEVTLPKKMVAIVENPFYSIMNEPNSVLKRLVHKINLLDQLDDRSNSGKLDLIIQLPYTVKSELRKQQAEKRRQEIEDQLTGTKYGIAYTDGTERITQLNRPLENNLMAQIEYLTNQLYGQLGITPEILNGTADEKTMLNYYTRTIEPIMSAIVDEMKRKFLTKTAMSQGQSIIFRRDPFKLVPVSNLADIADKFTRNAILSSNEIRSIVGFVPVNDERANELSNKNLNQNSGEPPVMTDDQQDNGDYENDEEL